MPFHQLFFWHFDVYLEVFSLYLAKTKNKKKRLNRRRKEILLILVKGQGLGVSEGG